MDSFAASQPSHLDLLNHLSQEFNSSLHVNFVLDKVMDEVIQTLHAERGFVMLKNGNDRFDFKVARGMDHQEIQDPDFQISRSVVEKVFQNGIPILTSDAIADERFQNQASVVALGLRSILCVPMKTENHEVAGIIYVDNHLQSGLFSKLDLDLLQAIASTAAIAIKNARLFEDLENAYEETLLGWAKAVELRDQETENHTLRVAKLTVDLARFMQLPADMIVHIRRGAMMHDIGKLGIPDGILLKTGELTEAEFEIMKLHTTHAYDMIYPIKHLRPAIDIPFCHHEKWDGSGYPRGLKEDQIPLAARIFAVVDVWDALRSNRPYREEWSKGKVIQYLKEQANIHFDPVVVQYFLEMIQKYPELTYEES